MKHLISLQDFSQKEILELIELANKFIDEEGNIKSESIFPDKRILTLFCEPSTRTKISFEIAAKSLGCHVINFDASNSSLSKGETLQDTVDTLAQMDIDLCVLRHSDAVIEDLINHIRKPMTFVSAGEGAFSHPTQGLLDLMTIHQHKGLENLNILIVGDLDHSRVYQSFTDGIKHFNSSVTLCGHPDLCTKVDSSKLKYESDLDKAIEGKDIIMALRIQHERMDGQIDQISYIEDYQVNEQRLQKANPNAILMHPGPVNKGIEITEAVYKNEQSVILDQVANGVAMRMAILTKYLSQ